MKTESTKLSRPRQLLNQFHLSSLKSVFENIAALVEEYRTSIGSATETISSLNNETLQLTTTLSNQKTNIPDLIVNQIANPTLPMI